MVCRLRYADAAPVPSCHKLRLYSEGHGGAAIDLHPFQLTLCKAPIFPLWGIEDL